MDTIESLATKIRIIPAMNDLSKLKKGDKVILVEFRYGSVFASIDTVFGVSKTGRVTINSKVTFKPDGRQYGGDTWGPSKCLIEYNDETFSLVKHRNAMFSMSRYISLELKVENLDFETMNTVFLIAKEQERKRELLKGKM